MLITIKKLDGTKESIEFDENDTISSIKATLAQKVGISAEQIRLIYLSNPLQDAQTLKSAKVQAGGTVHMLMHLRG